MSVQDKIERILKEIHVLFAKSEPFDESKETIIVRKQEVFALLKELNLAVYEVMDEYEITSQKRELAERRCQKQSEEIISRANRNVDDIYAASIIYTDDALNRIQHIMDETNAAVQRIMRQMNKELDTQKEQVRQNQSELKEQLQDFADTKKYLKIIQQQNQEREEELRVKVNKSKGKKIPNEGKRYTLQPEIKINKAYFEKSGHSEELVEVDLSEEDEVSKSLSKVTGKEFAESLRRRAVVRDEGEEDAQPLSRRKDDGQEEPPLEVKVDLDAEYFKWKEKESDTEEEVGSGKRDWKSRFGKNSRL